MPNSGQPSRILLIRPSALGDVCRSVHLLCALRSSHPGAEIDWLVNDSFGDAVAAHPDLSAVVPFPRAALGKAMRTLRLPAILSWLGRVRARKYDLVVDAQGLLRSGLIAFATGAPRRVGFADAREGGWAFLTDRVRVPAQAHTVDRMANMLEGAGYTVPRLLRLYVPGPAREWIRAQPFAGAGRLLVVAPGSKWPGKRWPAPRYRDLIARLLRSRAADHAVIVGTGAERAECAPVLDLAASDPGRVTDLLGSTDVGRLMGVISAAACVIANDSAAVHIAVGLDRPIVALYGPTRTELVGPYRRTADVIQHVTASDARAHKDHDAGTRLMERISVDEVVRAAEDRLSRSASRNPS